jgi:hypothetical protein
MLAALDAESISLRARTEEGFVMTCKRLPSSSVQLSSRIGLVKLAHVAAAYVKLVEDVATA